MKVFYIISILLLTWHKEAFAETQLCSDNCPLNEVYSPCKSGSCQSTCWNVISSNCSCTPGCICKRGYIRDPNTYQCIPYLKCPKAPKVGSKICPRNEVYSACMAGCQRNCDTNPNIMFKCKCIPGCICSEGFIRSSITNQCIPKASCKVCPPGYSMDVATGRCKFCCQECPENEKYNECGPLCEDDCVGTFAAARCMAGCKVGCFCKEGYIRISPNASCVPDDRCPNKECPVNEVFKECGTLCEPKCDKSQMPVICPAICISGCFCKDGYVLNPNGKCVLLDECPKPCPENETFSCGSAACEKNCATINDNCTIVNVRCDDKCFCNAGYVRQYKDGPCVPIGNCGVKVG